MPCICFYDLNQVVSSYDKLLKYVCLSVVYVLFFAILVFLFLLQFFSKITELGLRILE